MVNVESITKYLHEHIPISKAMGVEVQEASPKGVKLSAPLPPNINHRETVFGGSASAVAILSAWALLYLRLKNEDIDGRIVIQKSAMNYEHPIIDTFTAASEIREPAAWTAFVAALRRKGRARVKVCSILHCNDRKVGEFEGEFVALDLRTAGRST
jgi:thioesterase domain-containing protein